MDMFMPYADPTKLFHIFVNLVNALPQEKRDELKQDALMAQFDPNSMVQDVSVEVLAALFVNSQLTPA